MPLTGLGTYALDAAQCYNSVLALLDAGGRLIDTAYIYIYIPFHAAEP